MAGLIVRRRSILWHGLRLVLAHPGALVWTYAFQVGLALLFSVRLHAQLGSVLDRSLAAERLSSGFDLGTLGAVSHALSYRAPGAGMSSYAGLPVYLLVYFVLVPGTLFTYGAAAPGRLSILLSAGLGFFWRFVRITVLAAIAFAVVLGPLVALQSSWTTHVEDRYTGAAVWWYEAPGAVLIVLAAALLRLYFDLVEVYTVQLNDQLRPSGKPDRRVRRVLLPALQTLRENFGQAYGTFLVTGALGVAVLGVSWAAAVELLAQRQVPPIFLLAQAGLLGSLLTRFWQRGAETVLVNNNRLPTPVILPDRTESYTQEEGKWAQGGAADDAQPDPEPPVPSLEEPDAGVFQHDVPPRLPDAKTGSE